MSYWEGVSDNSSSEHAKTDPTVPAGYYTCEVIDFMAFARDGSDWKVKFTLRIMEGAHRDKLVVRWSEMVPSLRENNFRLFKNTLGEPPDFNPDHGFADLVGIQSRLKGAVVKCKCEAWSSNGKSGINVKIQQLVGAGGDTSVEPDSPSPGYPDDEVIPF
jgi:hypothetical protein